MCLTSLHVSLHIPLYFVLAAFFSQDLIAVYTCASVCFCILIDVLTQLWLRCCLLEGCPSTKWGQTHVLHINKEEMVES